MGGHENLAFVNSLDDEDPAVTGQIFGEGVGIRACFEALRPVGPPARAAAAAANASTTGPLRRGVGVAGMWYGCGNTSLPDPSTMRVGLERDHRIALHQGAVDHGQGSATVVTQICAEALGAPVERLSLIGGDTDITPDCGKTSASRQTFVSGRAARMAGEQLREKFCSLPALAIRLRPPLWRWQADDSKVKAQRRSIFAESPVDERGYVASAEATF